MKGLGSGRGFERRFFYRSFDDALGELAAFATLGGNAEFAADVGESAGTTRHGFANLAVGNGFAEANVHGIVQAGQLSCCELYS